jgi:hypothetical protein
MDAVKVTRVVGREAKAGSVEAVLVMTPLRS